MESVKVASWNIARGLSDEKKSRKVVDGLERLDADIVFLPEAFAQNGEATDPNFGRNLGYRHLAVEYEDRELHTSGKQYIVALSRVASRLEEIRLHDRNAIRATTTLEGQELALTGAHFDDRDELKRINMAARFTAKADPSRPTALIGDLNTMHADDPRARVLSHPVTRRLAAAAPHERVRSLATRLTDMATGDAMEILEEADFRDADPTRRATMRMGKLAIVQLDHLMVNPLFEVRDFAATTLPGSDHRAIAATLRLAA